MDLCNVVKAYCKVKLLVTLFFTFSEHESVLKGDSLIYMPYLVESCVL